ncbi:hypothetical protein GCM10011586_26270 [Silvibacterium dinghuense]|nr:hypothetical protein GCM10011586_26270 [Silvibacterium dinghuense]
MRRSPRLREPGHPTLESMRVDIGHAWNSNSMPLVTTTWIDVSHDLDDSPFVHAK